MKKLILIAVALVILGAIVCVASAAAINFDFQKLDNASYETNTYPVKDDVQNISIQASVEKIAFKPAEDGTCKVVCYEEVHQKHTVSVSGGTLTIRALDDRKLTDRFLFSTKIPEITVYLPESAYADLQIETHTGDIELPAAFSFDRIAINGETSDVTCLASANDRIAIALSTGDITIASVKTGAMDLRVTTGRIDAEAVNCKGDVSITVDTGKVKLQGLACANLTSEGSTGDITLNDVIAAETISIVRSTGDVEFGASDAESIDVRTSTGDVTGSLRSEKVFLTETHTGKIDVPKSITGGRCEVRTETGDIRLTVR